MTPQERADLVAAALRAQRGAYAPYSHFPVGAAVLTGGGRTYLGANVENASFGLTMCAERVAAGAAVASGDREFVAVAIALRGGGTPCGACRQVLSEFNPDVPILIVDSENPGHVRETNLATLLPARFEGPQS